MFCGQCGSKLSGEIKFCPNCGAKIYVSKENTSAQVFNVVLTKVGVNKFGIAKALEKYGEIDFQKAQELMAQAPVLFKKNVTLEEAGAIKTAFAKAGAKVSFTDQKDRYTKITLRCRICGAALDGEDYICKFCGNDNDFLYSCEIYSPGNPGTLPRDARIQSDELQRSSTLEKCLPSQAPNISSEAKINNHLSEQKLRCPNCQSWDVLPVTETKTDVSGGGYGFGKGCCGWILLGPLGLLCGMCGSKVKSQSHTTVFWVCRDCGHKFRRPEDAEAEQMSEATASCAKILEGSAVLYIAGNLLAENDFVLFGMPNWIFITLGVLGILFGATGVAVGCYKESIAGLNGPDKLKLQKNYATFALAVFAVVFLGGIFFTIADIRFFWVSAWIYITVGILGTIIAAFARLMCRSEDEPPNPWI